MGARGLFESDGAFRIAIKGNDWSQARLHDLRSTAWQQIPVRKHRSAMEDLCIQLLRRNRLAGRQIVEDLLLLAGLRVGGDANAPEGRMRSAPIAQLRQPIE